MNIAICDNHTNDIQPLMTELNKCLRRHYVDSTLVHIDQFSSASELLNQSEDYALIFLEIQLPDISGLDAARQLKERPSPPIIVFVTDSADYCLDSYDIGVEGYLLKPIQHDKFERIFERLFLTLSPPPRTLDIYSNRLPFHIPIHDILYIESIGRKCLIHTSAVTYEANLALNMIEKTIADSCFIRCYRSYLVNMYFVAEFKQDKILLTNGECVPLTLRKKGRLLQAYQQFLINVAADSQRKE